MAIESLKCHNHRGRALLEKTETCKETGGLWKFSIFQHSLFYRLFFKLIFPFSFLFFFSSASGLEEKVLNFWTNTKPVTFTGLQPITGLKFKQQPLLLGHTWTPSAYQEGKTNAKLDFRGDLTQRLFE